MGKMQVFRCVGCGKMLARTDGNTEIVCPRCGDLNRYDAETRKIEHTPKKDRHDRVTSSGVTFR